LQCCTIVRYANGFHIVIVKAIGEAITAIGNNIKKNIQQQQQSFIYFPKKHGETNNPPKIEKHAPTTHIIVKPIIRSGNNKIKPIKLKNALTFDIDSTSLKNNLFSNPSTHW
jgi:hypothetical protein